MKIAFLNPQGNFDRTDAYLTEHPDFGGQLVYVKEVALALADLGVDVDIITRRIEDPAWPGFEAEIDHYDIHADRVRIVRLECGGPGFLPKEELWPHLGEMVDRMVAFYGDRLPDAVATHYADGGWMGVLLREATGLPFTFTGHSLGAQKLERLGATKANFDDIDRRFHFSQRIAAERAAMQQAGKIIASTREERFEQYGHPLYLGAAQPEDDEAYEVIAPGINERIFHADPEDDDPAFVGRLTDRFGHDDRPVLLASSRLDGKKNVGGFVDAWLSDPALQEKARLVLFVRGVDDPFVEADKLRAEERAVLQPILDRIEAAGRRDSVGFVNAGSQQQLATAYRYFAGLGSVFVLPSLYEPFGLAPIEAAACGLAVVATRHGGPSEVFSGGTGVLIEPGDLGNFAHGLHRAIENQQQLARAAQAMVQERYTWRRTAEGYLAVAQALAAAAPERPGGVPSLDASDAIRNWLVRHG